MYPNGGKNCRRGYGVLQIGFRAVESARLRCRPVVRSLSATRSLLASSSLIRGLDLIGYPGTAAWRCCKVRSGEETISKSIID